MLKASGRGFRNGGSCCVFSLSPRIARIFLSIYRQPSVSIHALAHLKFICIICKICSLLKISVISVICGFYKKINLSNPLNP